MSMFTVFIAISFAVITGASQAASLLSDNFDDGVIDTSKWKLGVLSRGATQFDTKVAVKETGGRLSIAPLSGSSGTNYNGLISANSFNFTDGVAAIRLVQKSSSYGQSIFAVGIDNGNFLRFRAKSSTLYLESAAGGNTSSTSIKFSDAQQHYWRLRHISASNSIVFETSANGTSWDLRRTVTAPFSLSSVSLEINAGTSDSVSSPSAALFDDVQLSSGGSTPLPAPTPTPSATPTPTPAPTATPTPAPTATPTPAPTPNPTPNPTPAPGSSRVRGYLTTPAELRAVKQKADQNIQPYKASYDSLMSYLGSPTNWGIRDFTGVDVCTDRPSFESGAARVYGLALAYNLTGDDRYAAEARKHILEMSRSKTVDFLYSGSGSGCPLTMSRHTPGYVVAADLIADYPGWTAADKTAFLTWLNTHAYHLVDWASDERSTNWGGDGSNAAGVIADYFANSGMTLRDRNGRQWSPHDAYLEAKTMQLHRMNGATNISTGAPFPKMVNSVCDNFQPGNGYAHGIQPYGGIPEETGRGSTGCSGTRMQSTDSSWSYMHTTLTGMVMQAEMLLRRGDPSLYQNINSDGRGSLEKAMEYTVTPFGTMSDRSSIFELGYRYYRNSTIGTAIGVGGSRLIAKDGNSVFLHFGTLTHGFAANENPGPPPTVPAP